MLSNTIVKALEGTDILKYRMKLCTALFAYGVITGDDSGYYRGLEHALYLLDEMCRQGFEKVISNFKSQILNANIAKYRKILIKAIAAHSSMTGQTEYDYAFREGMYNALSILDDFCVKEFKKACIEAINKKFGGLNK